MIAVINGPNLNMLKYRDNNIYGEIDLQNINNKLKEEYNNIEFFQSNHEGEIIDYIHKLVIDGEIFGLIINPGAFSHYSYAIRDALEICNFLIVEVHLSDVENREEFRKNLVTGEVCDKIISGQGAQGYYMALDYILGKVGK